MPVITSYSLANSVSGALNTFVTAGDQARPTVHVKGNDWFAAWESGAEDIAYGSLNQTSPATDPEVAELTIDERIALVYTAGSAGATNIVGRVSSGIFSGDTFTAPEFTISTDFTGPHTNADVVRLGPATDPFAVTWERQVAAGNRDILATLVLPNGTHPVPVVVASTAADDRDPHVADLIGGFVVTWTTGSAVLARSATTMRARRRRAHHRGQQRRRQRPAAGDDDRRRRLRHRLSQQQRAGRVRQRHHARPLRQRRQPPDLHAGEPVRRHGRQPERAVKAPHSPRSARPINGRSTPALAARMRSSR